MAFNVFNGLHVIGTRKDAGRSDLVYPTAISRTNENNLGQGSWCPTLHLKQAPSDNKTVCYHHACLLKYCKR